MSEDRRKLFTLIATILGSTIVFLDGTVVNVALPAISEDLDAGLADQQWIVESYMLATVSLLLVGGATAWVRQREISTQGAVLVRPDRVVAWRSIGAAKNPTAELATALSKILGRA